MRKCDDAHRQFDAIANGEAKVGKLPDWIHVRGKAFWWVFQRTYESMAKAFETFRTKAGPAGVQPVGPPGDVYVCDPDEHREDPERILTVLWVPVG